MSLAAGTTFKPLSLHGEGSRVIDNFPPRPRAKVLWLKRAISRWSTVHNGEPTVQRVLPMTANKLLALYGT